MTSVPSLVEQRIASFEIYIITRDEGYYVEIGDWGLSYQQVSQYDSMTWVTLTRKILNKDIIRLLAMVKIITIFTIARQYAYITFSLNCPFNKYYLTLEVLFISASVAVVAKSRIVHFNLPTGQEINAR